MMRSLLVCFLSFCLLPVVSVHAENNHLVATLLDEAEQLYRDGNYSQATGLWEQAVVYAQSREAEQYYRYRFADSGWRSINSTAPQQLELLRVYRSDLERLAEEIQEQAAGARPAELWAQVMTSLADSFAFSPAQTNAEQAWQAYSKVLEWWAGATELSVARDAYLDLVWKASQIQHQTWPPVYRGRYWNPVPAQIYLNALEIAQSKEDRARAAFLLATANAVPGDPQAIGDLLGTVVREAEGTDWFASLAFTYAQWLEQYGQITYDEDGGQQYSPDYAAAVQWYQAVLAVPEELSGNFRRAAQRQLDQLVEESLQVHIEFNFLPQSPVTIQLHTRNVSAIEVNVYRLDFETEWLFERESDSNGAWYDALRLSSKQRVRTFEQAQTAQPYAPQHTSLQIEAGLDAGLYIVEARAQERVVRNYLQVGSAVLSGWSDGSEMLYFLADGFSGQALSGGTILTLERVRSADGSYEEWQSHRHDELASGLFKLNYTDDKQRSVVVIGQVNAEAAVLSSAMYISGQRVVPEARDWRIFAYADRPAYRPGETAHWKMIVRTSNKKGGYQIPAGESVRVEVVDAAGKALFNEKYEVSEMGTLWGEVALPEDAQLGMYQIILRLDNDEKSTVSVLPLLRVEEYRLPEYTLQVAATGQQEQIPPLLGDTVEAVVQVDYFSGGGVPAAEVEIVVTAQPWFPVSPLPGIQPFMSSTRNNMMLPRPIQGGEIVHRVTMVTDDNGRAVFSFPTSAFSDHGIRYEIQAHMVDQAGTAASGLANLILSHQLHYARLTPENRLHSPKIPQRIEVVTETANGEGLSTTGRLKVYREEWYEVWRGPNGTIRSGESWEQLRKQPGFNLNEWQLVRSEVRQDEVYTTQATTDAQGKARVSFTPERAGLYRAEWVDVPSRGAPVRAEATFWVADDQSDWLGVEPGFHLIVDTNQVNMGEDAVVMVTSPLPGQDVLVLVEGEGLIDYRLVRTRGGPTLIRFNVEASWVPNVRFSAVLVNDFRLNYQSVEADVASSAHYFEVSIIGAEEVYAPGSTAQLELWVKDAQGRPVAAELSLAVTDESVRAIQQSLHPSIVDYFYGQKRYFSSYFPTSLMLRRISKSLPTDEQEAQKNMVAESVTTASAPQAMFAATGMMRQQDAALDMSLDEVTVRDHFQSTAYWNPRIQTDKDGRATLEFRFPDNLTSWSIWAMGINGHNQVGEAEETVRTQLPLITSIAAPRFLVSGDQSLLRGIVRNTTKQAKEVVADFKVSDGVQLDAAELEPMSATIEGGMEWTSAHSVTATDPGQGTLVLRARDADDADGIERTLAVIENGILQQQWFSMKAAGGEPATEFDLPKNDPTRVEAQLQLTAFPEAAMLSALPQLLDVDEESIDALISSFFPLLAVMQELEAAGVDPTELAARLPGINLSTGELQDLLKDRLVQLKLRQLPTGGWGWYPGGGEDLYMTAYVLWGLSYLPLEHELRTEIANQAFALLERRINEMDANLYLQAWLLHAISAEGHLRGERPSRIAVRVFTHLWRNRERLNSYGRSLLALSAHRFAFEEEAQILATSLNNGFRLIEDRQPGTAGSTVFDQGYWPLGTRQSWLWYNNTTEGTAFALQALLAINSDTLPVDSVVRWLVLNRSGAGWHNHKTTAIAVVSLAQSLADKEHVLASAQFEIRLNGTLVEKVGYASAQAALYAYRLDLPGHLLLPGKNHLSLRRVEGGGVLYLSATVRYFTQDAIAAQGSLSAIERKLWLVDPIPTLLNGYTSRETPLANGSKTAARNDRLQAVVIFDVDNDFEYLKIRERRAAGLEAVETNSGYRYSLIQLDPSTAKLLREGKISPTQARQRQASSTYGRSNAYFEWRDTGLEVAIDKLTAGTWMLSYPLRAEFSGQYSWLPSEISTVYAAEVFANGSSEKIQINEARDREN